MTVTEGPLACKTSNGRTCVAHTRAYRDGVLVEEGFDVALVSDHLEVEGTVVWLDLLKPSHEDLEVVIEEFGLHPLAVDDAVNARQRPKLDTYDDHLYLAAYVATLDELTAELEVHEIGAFIAPNAFVTIRKSDGLDVRVLLDRWDSAKKLAGLGVSHLLHGLLD